MYLHLLEIKNKNLTKNTTRTTISCPLYEARSSCFYCFSRWGNTPMDEAAHFGHHDVVAILQQYQDTCSPPAADNQQGGAEKNLDTFL